MACREAAPGPEVLRLFYHVMGRDQPVARARIRRTTADMVAQSRERVTRTRALLERLKVAEREDQAMGWPVVKGRPENC